METFSIPSTDFRRAEAEYLSDPDEFDDLECTVCGELYPWSESGGEWMDDKWYCPHHTEGDE